MANPRLAQLIDKARNTSEGPGVYRMLDENGKILYVGKAKDLSHRVRSYFADNIVDLKTRTLVGKIREFEVILTQTEAEALILEAILIRKHKPRYNIQLKDDKSYPYVIVDRNHTFPKLMYARRPRKNPKVKIYGPFASSYSLRTALRLINRSFKLRDCSDAEFANRARPCINYQIGICTAPCVGYITPEAYQNDVNHAVAVLTGNSNKVVEDLTAQMEKHSAAEEFEVAAKLRDQIQMLQDTEQRPKTPVSQNTPTEKNQDVVGWMRKPESASVVMLFVRKGNLVDSASFHFDDIEGKSDEEVLSQFLSQFYLADDRLDTPEIEPSGPAAFPGAEGKTSPDEILLPFPIPEAELLQQGFMEVSGKKVEFVLPQRGLKHELVLMAEKNAEHVFDERQREKGSIYRVLSELKAKLRLENYPRRMECFDISNLGDTGIVASRVTFIEGKPDKTLYRHYKVRSTQTQNDFAAMREVLERRLLRSVEEGAGQEEPPDLLIVDGGKGQLAQAMEVMKELNVTGIDVVSLAKARNLTEEEAREVAAASEGREVEKTFERVFKPGRMNPILLAPDSPVCHLMQRIRDEAHRFAVEFQRKQRNQF